MRRLYVCLLALSVNLSATPVHAAPADAIRSTGQATTQVQAQTGELADRRTRNSKTSRNSNGTYTTTVSAGAINYRDPNGTWQPIDSGLTASGKSGYAWANRANSFKANFKDALSQGYLAIDARGKTFTLSLDGAASAKAAVTGSRVSYPAVLTGVDLRYDVGANGVKETLVLANADVPEHYRFTLTSPAGTTVRAVRSSDGSWEFFLPAQDDPVFSLAAPHASDRTAGFQASDPANNATLTVAKVGSDFSIDLSVDAAWLKNTDRAFPVELDPTISIQPDSQDAYFHGNVATDTGFHDNNGMIHIGDSDSHYDWSAVQFGLSSIPATASFRPKLTVTYTDGSHAIAPTVAVGSPAAGAVVRGSAVSLSAGATDDRRVDKVEFYVDGVLKGTATAAPFTISWDSTSPGNGTRTMTAKAYDDAGNVTTSSGVAVTVSNYANPTTSITAPA